MFLQYASAESVAALMALLMSYPDSIAAVSHRENFMLIVMKERKKKKKTFSRAKNGNKIIPSSVFVLFLILG